MRTFLDMARLAYTVRCEVFAKGGGEREVEVIEFPMTKPEMRAAGKRPWTEESQGIYGTRMYGLKCVLMPDNETGDKAGEHDAARVQRIPQDPSSVP